MLTICFKYKVVIRGEPAWSSCACRVMSWHVLEIAIARYKIRGQVTCRQWVINTVLQSPERPPQSGQAAVYRVHVLFNPVKSLFDVKDMRGALNDDSVITIKMINLLSGQKYACITMLSQWQIKRVIYWSMRHALRPSFQSRREFA